MDTYLTRELQMWHWWRGVSGLFYARRSKSSPPVVLSAENEDDLKAKVMAHIERRIHSEIPAP